MMVGDFQPNCVLGFPQVEQDTPSNDTVVRGRGLSSGNHAAVVTGSPQSRDAGLQILQEGGNAIDAAVASMLVQSVVENSLFCFGSEVPIMVFDANRNVVEVIAGLGVAPRLANTEWFHENRNGVIQGRGDIANVVVPGFLDACLTALDRYGSISFTQAAQPMLAELTLRANPETAGTAMQQRRQLRRGSEISDERLQIFVERHRRFLTLIERLCEAERNHVNDRRLGLRQVADYFYRGPVAREIDQWSRENGGLIRYADLAQHVTRIDDPLTIEYRDFTVYKCGVWTQGPYLLQTLRLLEGYDLLELGCNSVDYVHLVAEAMKLALADRDTYFGDPHFVDVPIAALLSDAYIELRRSLLNPQIASQKQQPGDPIGMRADLGIAPQDHQMVSGYSQDTTSCLVADRWGNVVAATPSGWGGVFAGETGVELGSRMIGLTTWPGHPSILEPGKRPRITLTPTLVLREGRPVLAISVAGGDQQDQAALQVLLNRIVFQLDPLTAVRQPRFGTDHHINWFGHTQAKLGSLTVPADLTPDNRQLESRGHRLEIKRPAATAVILTIDPESGLFQAAGEQNRFSGAY